VLTQTQAWSRSLRRISSRIRVSGGIYQKHRGYLTAIFEEESLWSKSTLANIGRVPKVGISSAVRPSCSSAAQPAGWLEFISVLKDSSKRRTHLALYGVCLVSLLDQVVNCWYVDFVDGIMNRSQVNIFAAEGVQERSYNVWSLRSDVPKCQVTREWLANNDCPTWGGLGRIEGKRRII
jgi:hypothetical protein